MRRARVIVRLAGLEFESYIETPSYGVARQLLGRRILSKVNIALMGTSGVCCQLKIAEKSST
ncbi:MAG: hypothetical protein RMJ28_06425 [Nitrososphaerota archaeon]|nr:hypothetical protein [Candidatus Calditenuaceae archaeon]MDW8073850.1 hypothetical protein [Nitrososphaerota archaeon]